MQMKFMHAVAVVAALSTSTVMAQEERGTARAIVAGKSVAVEYGRPVLAGRDMLGQARVDSPWRMGAGSPTSLTSDADLMFGSVAIPKGSYILTAVKDEKGAWSVIATGSNSQTKVAEVPLASATLKDSVEKFTIEVTGEGHKGEFAMMWGKARMSAPFTAK
jgi:hypothetical protein